MKALAKDFISKKLFNFYIFFLIIAFSYMIPLEIISAGVENSSLFNFIEKISFWIFDDKCTYSMYFPSFFMTILPLGFLYILSEKIKTSKFAFLNCIILSTSLGYILFTKTHLELSLSVSFALSAIYCCFFTYFCKDENKKYFWICSYVLLILSAFVDFSSVLAVVFSVLFSSIIFKKFKESIKYLAAMAVITILLLFKFQYAITPSFSIKSVISLILGSFPWVISLPFCFKDFKKLNIENSSDKFILLNIISISTIILCSIAINVPVSLAYPFLSSLIGSVWYGYIFQNEDKVKRCILFLIIAFVMSFITGIIFPAIQNTLYFETIKNILGL